MALPARAVLRPRAAAAPATVREWDGRTDRRTPYRFIDAAPLTMRTVLIIPYTIAVVVVELSELSQRAVASAEFTDFGQIQSRELPIQLVLPTDEFRRSLMAAWRSG